eukprot:767677-Hanusia_phi.AAC.4
MGPYMLGVRCALGHPTACIDRVCDGGVKENKGLNHDTTTRGPGCRNLGGVGWPLSSHINDVPTHLRCPEDLVLNPVDLLAGHVVFELMAIRSGSYKENNLSQQKDCKLREVVRSHGEPHAAQRLAPQSRNRPPPSLSRLPFLPISRIPVLRSACPPASHISSSRRHTSRAPGRQMDHPTPPHLTQNEHWGPGTTQEESIRLASGEAQLLEVPEAIA